MKDGSSIQLFSTAEEFRSLLEKRQQQLPLADMAQRNYQYLIEHCSYS